MKHGGVTAIIALSIACSSAFGDDFTRAHATQSTTPVSNRVATDPTASARDDATSSSDQFVGSPHILTDLIAAAEKYGEPFKSEIRDDAGRPYAYYLRGARYVGTCLAPFGRVHVATFFFIRSGPQGGGPTPPSHGHSFVGYFDESLRMRIYWRVDMPLEGWRLRFEGTTLLLDDEPIFDYARRQEDKELLIDGKRYVLAEGKPQPIPTW